MHLNKTKEYASYRALGKFPKELEEKIINFKIANNYKEYIEFREKILDLYQNMN